VFTERQYSKLCELCDSRTGCSQNTQRNGNQYATLDCLTKKGGDVAYVAYSYVQEYFRVSSLKKKQKRNMNGNSVSHTEWHITSNIPQTMDNV
jgi:hypothetical protein